ncbi:hypothetical protein [Paludibacter sp. 221]|uniref:hypothetical protein n=1 Tax=Paludibacter sp. 221 TaxID=2302939 RepID=UPI0013D67A12|nr:hypothetical protein [Paludibacter sp. 221]
MSNIELLIENNLLNTAKIELDSIHILYPRMVDARRTAKALEDTITRKENLRILAYCDSILPIKKQQADSIAKNFRFEKNENYQNTGNFVYKTLQLEANIERTYLRAYVDENADFYLISNYTGTTKLSHTNLKVSVGESYVQTNDIPTDNPMNHEFNDEGVYWEIVTFKNELAAEVPVFIAQYANERIKVTLQGKRNYTYYLTNGDKKALAETYNLRVAKKDVIMLEKEIQKAIANIEKINQRYSTPD